MRQHAGGLALFVAGHALATGHIHGARGAYSNVACLAPRTASKWYRQMQTDGAAALVIERRLQDFIGSHVAPLQRDGYSNAALDKLLAYAGGWSETGIRTRWPHRWIPEPVAARNPRCRTAGDPRPFGLITRVWNVDCSARRLRR